MKIQIQLPLIFSKLAGNKKFIEAEGITIDDALGNLTAGFPELRKHIYSDSGTIKSYINIYLNGEDIKYLQDENTILQNNDMIQIVLTIAGGN